MIIELTDKEVSDIRKALVIAMQLIDDNKNAVGGDRILCENLNKIETKLSDFQAQQ